MLTVLYKDAGGSETVIEAEEVLSISPHDKDARDYGAGVLVTLPGGERRIHYGATVAVSAGDKMREIFVMNDKGATVARYPL